MFLKQSTAVTVKIGPFVDQGDGFTPETSLTISQADIRLTKNGGDFAQTNNAAGATHDESGYYDIPLDTTDTNTLGTLRVAVSESGALPVWQDFMVVPANVWDSLFGADRLQVHAAEISNDLITSDALAASAVSEIQSGLATSSALATAQSDLDTITGSDGVTLATAQANYAPAKAGDEMDLVDAPNATAIAAIQSGLATPTNITAGTITTVTNLTNAPTNGDLTATMKASVNAEVDAAIETYHLDHLLAATYDPSSKPGAADALLNELVENDGGVSRYTANALEQAPTGGSAPTAVEIRQEMDANSTQFAAIVADTNELQTDWANGGRLDNILDARASQASVDTIDDFLDTEVAAILADTNELQTDWANGGRLDLILDSAAAGASPAAVADAVWDEALSGHATAGSTGEALSNAGSAGDPWATSLPGAYGAGTAGKIIGDNINATVSSRSSHSAADVWAAGTRTLTSFGTLIADIWAYATRTLSSFGSLVSDIWANGTRTITGGTVTTNSDKTGYSISGTKSTLDALNDVSAAQVNSEVDAALTDIHLDHLLAVDYDPASKPGASTALLNELIGNDSGVSQFTANALELGPGGVTAAAIADAVLEELLADHDDTSGSLAEAITLVRKLLQNRVAHSGTTITVYDDDSTTPLLTRTPKDKNGTAINSSSYDANIPAEVTRAA